MTEQQRTRLAAEALKASVRFSAEVISIVDMTSQIPLSTLNSTATITTMRVHIRTMSRFLDMLELG
jgi:hypothetical protein